MSGGTLAANDVRPERTLLLDGLRLALCAVFPPASRARIGANESGAKKPASTRSHIASRSSSVVVVGSSRSVNRNPPPRRTFSITWDWVSDSSGSSTCGASWAA